MTQNLSQVFYIQADPYLVTLAPDLDEKLTNLLSNLKINPIQASDSSNPVNLVLPKVNSSVSCEANPVAGVIPWSPPQVNWNPWTSCNIDEGPLANVSVCCLDVKFCDN